MMENNLSIYIHIPFCVQKCFYCDFLSAPANDETKSKYILALKREILTESKKYKNYTVKTVFFGGGTPSILDGKVISDIFKILRDNFYFDSEAEITIEMNPATANLEKMKELFNAGINRLSIGLQSANNNELKMIGRIHTYEEFLQTYLDARKTGFKNINIDLMSALPGQSFESFMNTLDKVIALNPEHISAYSLIIEEDTYLCRNIEKFPSIPSEEEDRKMYQETKNRLMMAGYERYEISNYSKPGYECRHNKTYWERDNYAGFGIGAASMVQNIRWKNTDNLQTYLEKPESIREDYEELSIEAQMEEFMFLGLRKMQGISKEKFEALFKKTIHEVYGEVLEKWINKGYLSENDTNVMFTDKGIDISNQILSDFLF